MVPTQTRALTEPHCKQIEQMSEHLKCAMDERQAASQGNQAVHSQKLRALTAEFGSSDTYEAHLTALTQLTAEGTLLRVQRTTSVDGGEIGTPCLLYK